VIQRRDVVILFSISMLVYGQQGSDNAPAPIEVTTATTTAAQQGSVLSFTLLNRSPKTVLGYVALLDFADSNGQPVGRATKVTLRGLEPARPGFLPGERWTDASKPLPKDSSGKLVIPKVSIDYVVFSDNSNWGKDVMRQSLHLQGILHGWMGARNRYKQILSEKGAQGLADDLNKEIPSHH
jgi:hypothetical protein